MQSYTIKILDHEPMVSSHEDFLVYPVEVGESFPLWEVLNPSSLNPTSQFSSMSDAVIYAAEEIESLIEEDES